MNLPVIAIVGSLWNYLLVTTPCLPRKLEGANLYGRTQAPAGESGSTRSRVTVRALSGRLSGPSVPHSKSGFYGNFVWARSALNRQKRRFPARAASANRPKISGWRRHRHGRVGSAARGRAGESAAAEGAAGVLDAAAAAGLLLPPRASARPFLHGTRQSKQRAAEGGGSNTDSSSRRGRRGGT